MDSKQEAFLKELLADFKVEAAEHYQAIVNGLIELEQQWPEELNQHLIETTFREIHSLKGASRAVNLPEIEWLCQSGEHVFHLLKDGKLSLAQEIFDVFHHVMDTLRIMLSEVENKEKSIRIDTIKNLQRKLERATLSFRKETNEIPPPPLYQTAPSQPEVTPVAVQPPSQENQKTAEEIIPETMPDTGSIRISTKKLTDILSQAEELIPAKMALQEHIKGLSEIHSTNESLQKLYNTASQFQRSFSRTIDDLLVSVKTTLLYPFSTVLDMMPKVVRDLAREQKKEVLLTIKGKEIEIDRRILEEMKDPLIHLIRNSVDHGLEVPEERTKNGKPPKGALSIVILQETNQQVMIRISDDGHGISKKKVLEAAIRNGFITAEAAGKLTEQEIYALIFRSGISTSQFITDLSGRGLGMAIVFEKIVKLGGTISIESAEGAGTTFIILLPLTLSTFHGIPVTVQDQLFIIPTNSVDQAIRITPDEIKTIEGTPAISLNGQMASLVYMSDVLGIPFRKSKKPGDSSVPALVIGTNMSRLVFIIDEVMGEQEGIVKDLTPILGKVKNIAGATILGNGKIVPVLNVSELLESAARIASGTAVQTVSDRMAMEETKTQTILVAEDSITARSLIRNILETAGYSVKTAVDGLEAYQLLTKEGFDLLVSDVEMPRMNGFELTARIREDQALRELPVILVTALETAEDRQRGMDAGANAYINKSSFEQNNLVETIHRLI